MNLKVDDCVYVLRAFNIAHIENQSQCDRDFIEKISGTEIIKGVIKNITNHTETGYQIYFYEAILLKFKPLIYNDLKVSDKRIINFMYFLRNECDIKSFHIMGLQQFVPNLDKRFVKVDKYVYPIDLAYKDKNITKIFLNFLIRVYKLDSGINVFIKKNLR